MTQTEREPLQLGIFMPNCSNAYSISTYRTGPDEWPYASNKRIALAAEAAGFRLSVSGQPLARFRRKKPTIWVCRRRP